MTLRRLLAFLVALSLVALPSPALAWSEHGHRLIAEIAYARLGPHARAEVDRLIAVNAAEPVAGCPIGSFSDASVWSDCVRAIPAFRNQSSWHYDNIPVCGPIPPRETWCQNGDCASAAIERAVRTLRDSRAEPRQRLRALARLIHMTGDIHQPLHAANNGDRGGNEVAVDYSASGGHPANLHAAWDSALFEAALHTPGDRAALDRLIESDAQRWGGGDASDWALQSNAVARSFIYARGRLNCGAPLSAPVRIDAAYARAAAPIIRGQIARAGVRLADTLNGIWP